MLARKSASPLVTSTVSIPLGPYTCSVFKRIPTTQLAARNRPRQHMVRERLLHTYTAPGRSDGNLQPADRLRISKMVRLVGLVGF